jgi:hypothetical protein
MNRREMIVAYLNYQENKGSKIWDYWAAFEELLHWRVEGEPQISEIKRQENFLRLKSWLREVVWPGANADDVEWLVNWVNSDECIPRKKKRMSLAFIDKEIDWAKVYLEKIDNDQAYRKLIDGIEVQLDKDQLKHQPKESPIGDREKGGGEKFADKKKPDGSVIDRSSKAWHEKNTMKYMADWANTLGEIPKFQPVYTKQAERHQLAGYDAPICFEGFCMRIGDKKYVSFHCYPNTRT